MAEKQYGHGAANAGMKIGQPCHPVVQLGAATAGASLRAEIIRATMGNDKGRQTMVSAAAIIGLADGTPQRFASDADASLRFHLQQCLAWLAMPGSARLFHETR